MKRKVILVIIFITAFLSCDGDFRQGSCDEGFFEQSDGNGSTFCVPITEEGILDNPDSKSDDRNQSDKSF